MINFESLFVKAKGNPIEYNGGLIHMVDRLVVKNLQRLRFVFDSANSHWRQGIHISTDGGFEVNGRKFKKAVVFWNDTAPKTIEVIVETKKGECWIKNVWDVGDGVMESWHNGAAMMIEDIGGSKLYRCNDGDPDEDFDDLVFRVEFI